MTDEHLDLKIMMTWQYTLAYHHSHVGMRNDIDNLKVLEKCHSSGAGLGSGEASLEKTFTQNYPFVSDFVERLLTKIPQGEGGDHLEVPSSP